MKNIPDPNQNIKANSDPQTRRSPDDRGLYLALEGGGTRSQAVIMDKSGKVLGSAYSTDVNTNFVSFDTARGAVLQAVSSVLQSAGLTGKEIIWCVSALVGPRFGIETFQALIPKAAYLYYNEREVVFARGGIFEPHGVAVVAATGATAWGLRKDDGRRAACGGWGSLLGDEGSAYAMGLSGLRAAVRAFEGRAPAPTRLVEAICDHFGFSMGTFHNQMIELAYQKPLSRAEIARVAMVVSELAVKKDPLATQIVKKVCADLTALALHTARQLFSPQEKFDVVFAGGLLNAGSIIIQPVRRSIKREFPQANLIIGREQPAVALGKLAIFDLSKEASC